MRIRILAGSEKGGYNHDMAQGKKIIFNAIGVSAVRLMRKKGNRLYVQDMDIINGTPLLDIKPYVPEFDRRRSFRIGWLKERLCRVHSKKAGKRFA